MRRRAVLFRALLALGVVGCAEQVADVPPRQLPGSPFQYPEDLWDAGVEGETLLEIHVSAEGLVDSARVERSSGYAAFDSAALTGARDLRFDPARRGEDPLAVRVRLPVQFQLSAESPVAGDSSSTPP